MAATSAWAPAVFSGEPAWPPPSARMPPDAALSGGSTVPGLNEAPAGHTGGKPSTVSVPPIREGTAVRPGRAPGLSARRQAQTAACVRPQNDGTSQPV